MRFVEINSLLLKLIVIRHIRHKKSLSKFIKSLKCWVYDALILKT